MTTTHPVLRSLHDLGAAAWFGGGLSGAVALNGATNDISDATERTTVAASGWARWAPVNAVAIGAHLIGDVGLLVANRERVRHQEGVAGRSITKTVLTAAALATTAYSGVLGAQLAQAGRQPADSGAVPHPSTPDPVAKRQQQLRLLQWATPVLVGAIVVISAVEGEAQQPQAIARGAAGQVARRAKDAVGLG